MELFAQGHCHVQTTGKGQTQTVDTVLKYHNTDFLLLGRRVRGQESECAVDAVLTLWDPSVEKKKNKASAAGVTLLCSPQTKQQQKKRPRFLQLTFSRGGRFVAGFFAAALMKVTCLTPPAMASATSEETAQNSSWALVDSKERKRGEKNNGILFTALALPGKLMWDYTEMISSTLS